MHSHRNTGRITELGAGTWLHSDDLFEPAGFTDALLNSLGELGLQQSVQASPGLRAFVHRAGERRYVFFFHFGSEQAEVFVEHEGVRLELTVGCKTSGVVRLDGERIVSAYVKGVNEVEGITADVALRCGGQVVEGRGDLLWFLDP